MADTKTSAFAAVTGNQYGSYVFGVTTPTTTPTDNVLQVGEFFTEQWIATTSTYTTSSGSTSLQKLFNTPTNGLFNVTAATSYFFECDFDLSGLSATSGSISFGFLGTATITSIRYTSVADKGAITGTGVSVAMTTFAVATASQITPANTGVAAQARISGIIRVNAAGTLIPAFAISIAAAAVVGVNSWFRLVPIGTNTTTSSGNVS